MIWGITLEPGQAHTEVIEDEVHLSMATMESRGCIGSKADNFSHVVIKTGTTEYLLCTLVNGITYQQCLDLKLMPSDKVTFSVQGTNVVYLTGYSFASSETDQEITQTEDWIEDPVLEEDLAQDSQQYSEDDNKFQPAVGHDEIQRQQQIARDEEDQEQFSVQYEVPAAEQQYQYVPERGHQQITHGAPSSSSQVQPQRHPSHDTETGASSLEIKEEIHTVVDTEEDVPINQANEDIPNQSNIHQPSTSSGQNYQEGNEIILSNIMYPLTPRQTSHDNCEGLLDSVNGSSEESAEIVVHPNRVEENTTRSRRSSRQTLHRNSKNIMSQKPGVQCRFCEAKFFYPSQLKVHETKHTGERNYKCSLCGKGFRHQSNKIAHESIHTGVKPFHCDYCGKRFRQQAGLQAHKRTHTGERPFMCLICGKAYKQHGHLKEHSKRHIT